MNQCLLCASSVVWFCTHQQRTYYRCSTCFLLQLDVRQHPSAQQELEEYRLHENDPQDSGYRRFLHKVTHPMMTWLATEASPDATILDFGSGPGPTISVVLEERGWTVVNYDPFFAPDAHVLTNRYDLISCTEVVEHFQNPRQSWAQLFALRKEQGQVIVMTQPSDQHSTEERFKRWRYIRETSHVVFYHTRTMAWIATAHGLELSVLSPSVFWFSKP